MTPFLAYRRTDSSWAKGTAGKQATARLLARLERRGHAVLHDRAAPGSPASLDHPVPAGSGLRARRRTAVRSRTPVSWKPACCLGF